MSTRIPSLRDDVLARLLEALAPIADLAVQLDGLTIPANIEQLVGIAESGIDVLAGSSVEPDDSCLRSACRSAVRLRAALLPLSGGAPGVIHDCAGRATEPGMVLEALHLLLGFGVDYPLDILLDLAVSAAMGVKYGPDDVEAAVRVARYMLEHPHVGGSLDVVTELTRDLHSRWGRPNRTCRDGVAGTPPGDRQPAEAQPDLSLVLPSSSDNFDAVVGLAMEWLSERKPDWAGSELMALACSAAAAVRAAPGDVGSAVQIALTDQDEVFEGSLASAEVEALIRCVHPDQSVPPFGFATP